MRAESIIRFEQFYLAGGIVFELNLAINSLPLWQDPGAPWGGLAHLLAGIALRGSIYLLFWFFIVRRRSAAAKWLLIAINLAGLLEVLHTLMRGGTVVMSDGLMLLGRALIFVAIAYLFRRDAVDWLRGRDQPEAFDAARLNQ